MKFFCICTPKNEIAVSLLKAAAVKKGIEFVPLDPYLFDFSQDVTQIVRRGDLVYRCADTFHPGVFALEQLFLRQGVSSFYLSLNKTYVIDEDIELRKANIHMPKTVDFIFSNRQLLSKYVEYLGGFPLILKTLGKSKGVGVMKIDSYSSLLSIIDFLATLSEKCVLKEYIDVGQPAHSYRAAVIGNSIPVAYKNISTSSDDFRSNTNQLHRLRQQIDLPQKDQNSIIEAVHVLGLELGGVDFVYDKNGQLTIFEVNFPFNFVPIAKDIGFPIQDSIVDYLINKSRSI